MRRAGATVIVVLILASMVVLPAASLRPKLQAVAVVPLDVVPAAVAGPAVVPAVVFGPRPAPVPVRAPAVRRPFRPRPPEDLIEVSIADQRLIAWHRGRAVMRLAVSTGRSGFPTPRGRFAIVFKTSLAWSNKCVDALGDEVSRQLPDPRGPSGCIAGGPPRESRLHPRRARRRRALVPLDEARHAGLGALSARPHCSSCVSSWAAVHPLPFKRGVEDCTSLERPHAPRCDSAR